MSEISGHPAPWVDFISCLCVSYPTYRSLYPLAPHPAPRKSAPQLNVHRVRSHGWVHDKLGTGLPSSPRRQRTHGSNCSGRRRSARIWACLGGLVRTLRLETTRGGEKIICYASLLHRFFRRCPAHFHAKIQLVAFFANVLQSQHHSHHRISNFSEMRLKTKQINP